VEGLLWKVILEGNSIEMLIQKCPNIQIETFLGPNGTCLLVPFQGPKKSLFSGPTPSNAPHNDVAPLKIIMYRAIKTTGTLKVITVYWLLSLRIK
jgi:hypothetical protein